MDGNDVRPRSVSFTVAGLPPKKDGANSMWRKAVEVERLIRLREAGFRALAPHGPFSESVRLRIGIWPGARRGRSAGDLDSYIAGICDGLQPAHGEYWRQEPRWLAEDLASVRPDVAIGLVDDSQVVAIEAYKFPDEVSPRYEVEISTVRHRRKARLVSSG